MSLVLSIERLESLIMVPVDKWDAEWAREVCTASRFVHLNVWIFTPKREQARDIIKLLQRARKDLLSMVNSGDFDKDKKVIEPYIENVGGRIRNLKENYLVGKPSAFVPDDKLSEPRHETS